MSIFIRVRRAVVGMLVMGVIGAGVVGGVEPTATAQGLCELAPTFDSGLTPVREVHVAPPPVGNNQTGDGTLARPYATIARAVVGITPGTAVRLRPGTYAGGTFLNDVRGTAVAPIWIGGYDDGSGGPTVRPMIEGATEGLHLVRCAYVVVHDLEIRNASGNGVNSDDGGLYDDPTAAHHQVFRSLYIHDIGGGGNQDGLKLSGLYDFAVIDCEMTRCGGSMSGSGIDMVGCHDGVIARTFMHDLSANAVQTKGGTTDVLITRCRMVNAGERALNIGGSTGLEFFRPPVSKTATNAEARRVRAVANVIVGANAAVAFVGATECVASNNTIIEPARWIMRILQETTSTPPYVFEACANNTFSNNLVYFRRGQISTYVNIGGNTSPGTFVFRNNLWYAHDNPSASTPGLPSAEVGGVYGVNPQMRDVAGGSYAICAASPAAGSGLGPAVEAGDVVGTCYRTPPAIGAFELPEFAPADFNQDGAVNTADFFDFLVVFFAMAGEADFNHDDAVNSQDFFDFVAAFVSGC